MTERRPQLSPHALRSGCRRGGSDARRAVRPAAATAGAGGRHRCRQGVGADGRGGRERLGAVRGARGHPLRLWRGRPRGIEIVEAAHPVPDARGLDGDGADAASRRRPSGEDDLVLAPDLGRRLGAARPAGRARSRSPRSRRSTTRSCASGAPIGEMNIVRKHLSRVKGGQLAAAAWPARVLTLMISDVPGDDPALIASGPTVGDGSTPADARAILARWRIAVPPSVAAAARDADRRRSVPDDPRLAPDREPGDRRAVAVAGGGSGGCRGGRLRGAPARRRARGRGARGRRLAGGPRPQPSPRRAAGRRCSSRAANAR